MTRRRLALLPLILALTACAGAPPKPESYFSSRGWAAETPDASRFRHCVDYGCRVPVHTGLSEAEFGSVRALFTPKPATAAEERRRIAKAIGLMERLAGAKTGTAADKAGTYAALGPGQIDCVSESINTTIFLQVLSRAGLIPHHDVLSPTGRFPITGGGLGPHQTAAILDRADGTRYAVDSWFFDNGHDAAIAPLSEWYFGWRPAR